MLGLVTSSRVGVVVYPGVTGELVGAGEALGATWILAGMGFLAGMCADMPGLMFEAVEGPVAERALVRSGEVLVHLVGGGTSTFHEGR
jgi:hypothetical protein